MIKAKVQVFAGFKAHSNTFYKFASFTLMKLLKYD